MTLADQIVWVLIYALDYGGDEFQSEVVGVFDSAESAQASVPGAQWEQTKFGDYEAKGHRASSSWFLTTYALNEYTRPRIAPDHWEEL